MPVAPDPFTRLTAHLLGSLGLMLWLGGLLTSASLRFLEIFPWEAAVDDRISSVLCGGALIATARSMLMPAQPRSIFPGDDDFG